MKAAIIAFFVAIAAAAPSTEVEKRADGGAYFCDDAGFNNAHGCYHFTGDGCQNLADIGWANRITAIGADQGYSCTLFTKANCEYVDYHCCPGCEGCGDLPTQLDVNYPGYSDLSKQRYQYQDRSLSIQCWS